MKISEFPWSKIMYLALVQLMVSHWICAIYDLSKWWPTFPLHMRVPRPRFDENICFLSMPVPYCFHCMYQFVCLYFTYTQTPTYRHFWALSDCTNFQQVTNRSTDLIIIGVFWKFHACFQREVQYVAENTASHFHITSYICISDLSTL